MEIRIFDHLNRLGIGPGTILDFFLTASASQEKRPATQWAELGFLVASTGFESDLRLESEVMGKTLPYHVTPFTQFKAEIT